MRPSGIASGSTRAIVKAAVAVPAAVATGRCICTNSRTRKSVCRKPPMRLRRVGDRQGRKMHSGMALQRGIEFAAERRIGGLEQNFEIAARQHGGDVAGSGRAARRRPDRDWPESKSASGQNRNGPAPGWRLRHHGRNGRHDREKSRRRPGAGDRCRQACCARHVGHSEWAMPASSTTLPQRTISDCRNC